MRIIGNRSRLNNISIDEGSIVRGSIDIKLPAEFIAFQILLDEFEIGTEPNKVIRERIVDPIIEATAT